MPIIVDATYENGVLKPAESLPLAEHEHVRLTVERRSINEQGELVGRWEHLIPCHDSELIERAALDAELEF